MQHSVTLAKKHCKQAPSAIFSFLVQVHVNEQDSTYHLMKHRAPQGYHLAFAQADPVSPNAE